MRRDFNLGIGMVLILSRKDDSSFYNSLLEIDDLFKEEVKVLGCVLETTDPSKNKKVIFTF